MEGSLFIDREEAFFVAEAGRTLICSFLVVPTCVDVAVSASEHDNVVGNVEGWLAMTVTVFAVMIQLALLVVD